MESRGLIVSLPKIEMNARHITALIYGFFMPGRQGLDDGVGAAFHGAWSGEASAWHMLSAIALTAKRVVTNVAMVHEAGHPEPLIIALSEPSTVHRAFDYGLRWGIEAMFSDFKTRGAGWKIARSSSLHP